LAILKALVGTRLPEKYRKFLDLPERRSSYRYTDTRNTALGAMSALVSETGPMRSGIYRLKSGREALGARLALIDAAEISIDIQSYLIRYDIAGNLLSQRLVAAARRGVRVRLLMDDALTPGSDDGLTVLDGHEGIEVRVFNPFPRHRSRLLSFLLNFNLLNRRMHNKSFTVDNAVTIVGGRNIADEYYQTSETDEFLDEDLLAAGEVVDAVGQSFDEYWNAREACPVHFLRPALPEAEAEAVIQNGVSLISEPRTQQYIASLDVNFVAQLVNGDVPLSKAHAEAVYDEPAKIRSLVRNRDSRTMLYLRQLVSGAESEVIIVSPYFVPRRQGVDFLSALVRSGVRVVVITNSLASTNHSSVHAVYARYRKPLLRQGVELYEISSDHPDSAGVPDVARKLTLHSKVVIVDRRATYVGSFNLDPRSVFLNTEMGLGVDCTPLAEEIAGAIMQAIPRLGYRLSLNARSRLTWSREGEDARLVYRTEPETRFARRWWTRLMGLLPIESQM
jgi:putative cardiolipin synthase